MKKQTFKLAFSLLTITGTLLLSGCLKQAGTSYMVNLEVWGMFDSSGTFEEIVNQYKSINPFIGEIKFRKFTAEEYRRELIDGLAAGQGPDIFLINNSWMPTFKDKIVPAPDKTIRELDVKNNFVDVVADDFVEEGKVYGVPLSVDSLALFYNKDLFNAKGITAPPATWDELVEDVKKFTERDEFNNITRSGVAMGTAYNINRSTDILSLLMMQRGGKMSSRAEKKVFLSDPIDVTGESTKPAETALDFYTKFSNITSDVYTWNPRMHYSIDSFSEGVTAMMLNYSWTMATVEKKNPKLNFAIAPVPQIAGKTPITYANYSSFVVAKNKRIETNKLSSTPISDQVRIFEAWEFLKYLTLKTNGTFTVWNAYTGTNKDFGLKEDPAVVYASKTGRPAARKDIIEKQKDDPILSVFAEGNLIARNWYQSDAEAVELILAEAIDSINNGSAVLNEALRVVDIRINKLPK